MTNKELAKQLGLSPAALSLVINHKPGVSDETRSRILNEIRQMGMGHLIKEQVQNTISFIIYKRNGEILDMHPFFLLLMEIIEKQAQNYGYNILLSTIDKRQDITAQIDYIRRTPVSGAILFGTEMQDEDITYFESFSIPVVVLDNHFGRFPFNTVSINNEMGTYQAIDHLVQNGHKRIGYLKGLSRISSFNEREQGYASALRQHSLSFLPEDIWNVQYTEEGSYRDIRNYLTERKDESLPSAFVCDDDTMAVGAIRAFTEAGLRVPEDVSIIGYNDRPSCQITMPPLTSVNVSKNSLATAAVDELMRLILHPEIDARGYRSRKIRIGTKLTIRDSVIDLNKA